MSKTNLESSISEAAEKFAMEIVSAVKDATLQELIALQADQAPKKRGPKPGRKPGRKPGPKPGRKPGRPPKAKKEVAAPAKKKRVATNYPKCAYPRCTKNRFPRGKGFCGKHWKEFEAGKIKSASSYKKGKK